MKKVILALTCCLVLAACGTTSNIDNQVSQVQSAAKNICRFVPTVGTVAKILSNSTAIDTVAGIASAICSAVTTAPLADGPGDRLPRVKGVVVRGKFV